MEKPNRHWSWVCAGVLLWWSLTGLIQAATPPPDPSGNQARDIPSLSFAFETALRAANLAQTAETTADWNQVSTEWAAAIETLQTIPAESPEWVFSRRKVREYMANQAIAQRRAEAAGAPVVFPHLGSAVLDEQLGLYLSYVAALGPPDVMVIGSSRALQGIDPQILQSQLSRRVGELNVYTFAVNGATAQVVSFILRQLLTPEQLPRMVIWAGGSRSFNSARLDRTFAAIAASPGYRQLQSGQLPALDWAAADRPAASPMPVTTLNGYGFLPVTDIFVPEVYYRSFPRVSGRYDAAYQPFELEGVQTVSLRAIAQVTEANNIPLVFVNLPLSSDYLDETRRLYEGEFQRYLQREAAAGGFTMVDMLQLWPTQNYFFADPSHLNQRGASAVATILAGNAEIPWQQLIDSQ